MKKKLLCRIIVGVSGVILGTVGCIIQPPPTIAPVVSGNRYTKEDAKQFSIPDDVKVLSMDFCIQLALKNNPDVLSKAAAINAAWSRYYQSLSGYAPSINMGAGYAGKTSMYPGGVPSSTSNGYNLTASASLLVFNGLTREMNVLVAQYSAKQSEELNADARRLLIQAVGTSYNTIQAARETIRIQEENRRYNQGLLEQADAKYKAGTTALSDVLNFEIQLYQTQIQLIAARADERIGRYMLAQLMGLTTSTVPESIGFPAIKNSTYILSDVNIYLDAALKNRPDLKAYRYALKSAEYTLYSIYGEYSPTIYATGGAGLGGAQVSGKGMQNRSGNGNWGATADWNVFNGFKTWNRIREAHSLLEIGQYAVATQWIAVINEVRQAHQRYAQYEEQLAVTLKKLALVKRTRELVVEQYKAGTTEVVRVNEAQRDVVDAETQVANLLILIVEAKIRLDAATGFAQ